MAKTLIGTATTDANGVATITYESTGAGDINIVAECENSSDTLASETYEVCDVPSYDGTRSVTDDWEIISGNGSISYIQDGGNALYGATSSSSDFIVAPKNVNITDEMNFTLECDWKATNYWNGGKIRFQSGHILDMSPYGTSGGLVNYRNPQNSYFHIKIRYYNKKVEVYINNSLIGTATNTNRTGRLCFHFGGDRTNFYYYVKNIKIYQE